MSYKCQNQLHWLLPVTEIACVNGNIDITSHGQCLTMCHLHVTCNCVASDWPCASKCKKARPSWLDIVSVDMTQAQAIVFTVRWPDVPGFRGQSPFLVACPRQELSPEMSPVFTVTNNRPGIQIKKRKKENNDQMFSSVAYTPQAQASQPAARGTSSSSELKDVLECPSL